MELKHSGKSVYLCNYHIVWCPKFRRKLLVDDIKNRLEEIIKDVAYAKQFDIIALEIMPDHVHLFISANLNFAPYKLVKAVKGRSSNLLRKEFPSLLKMHTLWTRGFFLSTSGNASTETITNYIENQWKK